MDFADFKSKFQKVPVIEHPNKTGSQHLLSVCVTTFQHQEYIRECLESILMQQTDFDFEILVGDDGSIDGTREICIEYAERFPDKIRLILHDRENNIKISGVATGRFNILYNLFSAKGMYVACCEGDDYWTDPLKLQKQVDFLSANEDCVACHHWQETDELKSDGTFERKPAPKEGHGYFPQRISSVGNIFSNKLRVKSRTLMFRNVGLQFPFWFSQVAFGDVPLSMLLGKYGKFGFIDEPMAVYRLTGKGLSAQGAGDPMYIFNHYLAWIKIWELGSKEHKDAYQREANQTMAYFYKVILKKYPGFKMMSKLFLYCLVGSHLSISNRLDVCRKIVPSALEVLKSRLKTRSFVRG